MSGALDDHLCLALNTWVVVLDIFNDRLCFIWFTCVLMLGVCITHVRLYFFYMIKEFTEIGENVIFYHQSNVTINTYN